MLLGGVRLQTFVLSIHHDISGSSPVIQTSHPLQRQTIAGCPPGTEALLQIIKIWWMSCNSGWARAMACQELCCPTRMVLLCPAARSHGISLQLGSHKDVRAVQWPSDWAGWASVQWLESWMSELRLVLCPLQMARCGSVGCCSWAVSLRGWWQWEAEAIWWLLVLCACKPEATVLTRASDVAWGHSNVPGDQLIWDGSWFSGTEIPDKLCREENSLKPHEWVCWWLAKICRSWFSYCTSI